MLDPITLRILGLLLVAGGALAVGLTHFGWLPPELAPSDPSAPGVMTAGGVAAALGALLIVFSAFFRRGRHGLNTTAERRTGKPSAIRRLAMFWGGIFLVILSPLVGAIPGPGGIVVFAAGFGLMLRGSRWVKKKYARFKRRHPKKGDWADFGLRRGSYKRRQARLKATAEPSPAGEGADLAKLEPSTDR
jgi:hypothetical protein